MCWLATIIMDLAGRDGVKTEPASLGAVEASTVKPPETPLKVPMELENLLWSPAAAIPPTAVSQSQNAELIKETSLNPGEMVTGSASASPSTVALSILPNPNKPQLVHGKFEVVRVTLPSSTTAVSASTGGGTVVSGAASTNVNVSVNVTVPTVTADGGTQQTTVAVVAATSVAIAPPVAKERDTVHLDPHKKEQVEESDDDEGKESKHNVVETSPCGRYHKRRERVLQREVPGIDAAFLAMDTEEGREVVWNEVQFSEKKNFKEKEEQIHQIFDNLINLHHPSILKFHRWWTDVETVSDKTRVIFITEHISSGSLNHFIKTSKHSNTSSSGNPSAVTNTNGTGQANMPEKSWKRWSRQILTALNYLHSAKPPIVHGNLNLDTVFLQHNGLIKIGCVAPDTIHQHVRTCREHINVRNMHFVAPEYAFETVLTPAADIYSFGILTLEMFIYGIHTTLVKEKEKDKEIATTASSAVVTGTSSSVAPSTSSTAANDTSTHATVHSITVPTTVHSMPAPTTSLYPITPDMINTVVDMLDEGPVKRMLRDCLNAIPEMRPSAKNLLFHPAFFEVPPLKQIAAFAFVDYFSADHLDNWNDMAVSYGKDTSSESVIAENPRTKQVFRVSQLQNADLDKYLEDIRQGVYPLTAWGVDSPTTSLLTTPAQSTRDEGESFGMVDEFEEDFVSEVETRLIMSCMCTIRSKHDTPVGSLELILRMEDKMNRHLTCDFDEETDCSDSLAEELLEYGLINEQDQDKLATLLEATLRNAYTRKNDLAMECQLATQLSSFSQQSSIDLSEKVTTSSTNGAMDDVGGMENSLRNQSLLNSSTTNAWDVVFRSPVTTFNTPPVQTARMESVSVTVATSVSSTTNGVATNGNGVSAPEVPVIVSAMAQINGVV